MLPNFFWTSSWEIEERERDCRCFLALIWDCKRNQWEIRTKFSWASSKAFSGGLGWHRFAIWTDTKKERRQQKYKRGQIVGMWVWFWINKNINFLIFFYIRFNFGGINFKFLKLKLNWMRIFNQQRNIRCW